MATFQPQRVGEVRLGQALHTYGVGALADLPNMSVMTSGLQRWPAPTPLNEIQEPRLLGMVKSHLGSQVERLCKPPVSDSDNPFSEEARIGVPVIPFPQWVRCPYCELLAPLDYGVFELKLEPFRVDRTRYLHANCTRPGRPPEVVPARFVVACENGHIDNFPWMEFVGHKTPGCRGPLEFRERGLSSEVADLWVSCRGCSATKLMTHAFGEAGKKTLTKCTGRHPHLGPDFQEECNQQPKAVLIGASNLWFPILLSALHLPPKNEGLGLKVEENWPVLKEVQAKEELAVFRRMGHLRAFDAWKDDAVIWEAIEAKRNAASAATPKKVSELKLEEWQVFSRPSEVKSTKDFQIRSTGLPSGFEKYLEDVVLVERLRVVRALTGFTRLASPGDYGDPSEIPDRQRAPLSRAAPTWVPSHEVRGEGLFLRFREETLAEWLERDDVRALEREFHAAHRSFRAARGIENPGAGFPGMRYILLHSLSHTLNRQLAIECGYSAASVEERIYAGGPGSEQGELAGILLFTAAADSEGTLGGLVALGEPAQLRRHLRMGLERLELCASDPLCAEHRPEVARGVLHGAACHACSFVSETSCERGNKYLDRSVLVRTVSGAVQPFFSLE